MCAEPSPGQLDPEDQEDEEELLEDQAEMQLPKHYAVQVSCEILKMQSNDLFIFILKALIF